MSDDFLSRWSRRKRAAETPSPAAEAPPEPTAAPEAAEPPAESDAQILARLGLRHPDEMAPGDDFAAFLRAEVPKHLKTLAYRRLWRSSPTLACLDGLNDYDGDFAGGGASGSGLRTSYQVGRGLLRRLSDVADGGETAAAPPAPPAEAAPSDAVGGGAPEPAASVQAAADAATSGPGEGDEPQPAATRRRMVFRTTG